MNDSSKHTAAARGAESIALAPARLAGPVQLPPSKSELHRLLIAEFLCEMRRKGGVFPEIGHLKQRKKGAFCYPGFDQQSHDVRFKSVGQALDDNFGRGVAEPVSRVAEKSGLAGNSVAGLDACQDVQATQSCLAALAASDAPVLNCRESASTLRFLLPVAAALGKNARFTGADSLSKRPLQPLLAQLVAHGCRISGESLPLALSGQLASGTFELTGSVSSQFVSGLLFALPLLEGESRIILTTPLESGGYVELTRRVLRLFGVRVQALSGETWHIPGGQSYRLPQGGIPTPEPDYSAAAFWLVANALGAAVEVGELPAHSAQPCRAVIELLAQMKGNGGATQDKSGPEHLPATTRELPVNPKLSEASDKSPVPPLSSLPSLSGAGPRLRGARLKAIDFDASAAPDLVPALAVAMAVAEGTSHITHAARLRCKESDRLAALATQLRVLGARITEDAAGLTIEGVERLRGGEVSSCGDHRIALALAVAATVAAGPVILNNPGVVAKSYPDFWQQYQRCGGSIKPVATSQENS